jgi:NADPH2:quinone reductase
VRALVCDAFGEPETLRVEDRPAPPCPPDRVRIRVGAAGVNYVDALFVQGRYQIRPPLPFTPGSEVAGEITEVGPDVRGWRVGDRVAASVGLGGFAEEVVVHPDALLPLPAELDLPRAATFGQSYATAWFCLTRRTRIAPGEQVAVLGAAGGVGLACLDVAAHLGARTVAVASSADKLRTCTERGADVVVDASAHDVKARLREVTGGGADVVVDPVGGELSEAGLRALREGGRLLVVGFASGDIARLPANQVLLRNRSVLGVDWGAWAMAHPRENRVLLGDVVEQVGAGRLDPVAPDTFDLADAAVALRALLERRVTGKVCLTP